MNEPDDATLQKVRTVVSNAFKLDRARVIETAPLATLPGWDSLGHITLMMEIEREFAVRIPTDRLNEPKTIGEIARLVTEVGIPPNAAGQASA